MKDKKQIVMKLVDIKETFVVRLELNRSHVDYLKDLIDTGVELENLLVSEDDNELIDGRHRKAAYKELNISEVKCSIRKFASQADKIITALTCNVGGSLPPSPADISHVMQILLSVGESRKSIIEQVSLKVGFPARLVRDHLDLVQSNLAKARLKKAVTDVVSHGKTVPEAASENAVNLKSLQKLLDAKGEDNRATSINQVKSHLSIHVNKVNSIIGQNLSKVVRDLSDGLIQPEEAAEVMSHFDKLAQRFSRRHEEWVKRFASHTKTAEASADASKVMAVKSKQKKGKQVLALMGLLK